MDKILSVSDINRYVKDMISRDLILSDLWVRGEVSNFKLHYSGHMYFTLKDEKSLLKCVMFKSYASGLRFNLENGMKVIVRGYVSVFERDGQYQLYAEELQPDGLGALFAAFEQMKKKLEAEGLFSQERKRKLPYLPSSIGVVTSSTGAVIRDIVNVLTRRFPNVSLKLYPVQVQGEQAAGQIAHAIGRLNELDCVDVIILARGGGSLEELWAFNEEIVARSIFTSKIPVISAVGHETDYTIADYVADVRAPTPSAAAEIVIPEKRALCEQVVNLKKRLANALIKKEQLSGMRLERAVKSPVFRQPYNKVYQERMKLEIQSKSLIKAIRMNYDTSCKHLALLAGRLNALSPLNTLSRGYGILQNGKDRKIIKSVNDVKPGESIEIKVLDGKINCEVIDTEKTD